MSEMHSLIQNANVMKPQVQTAKAKGAHETTRQVIHIVRAIGKKDASHHYHPQPRKIFLILKASKGFPVSLMPTNVRGLTP